MRTHTRARTHTYVHHIRHARVSKDFCWEILILVQDFSSKTISSYRRLASMLVCKGLIDIISFNSCLPLVIFNFCNWTCGLALTLCLQSNAFPYVAGWFNHADSRLLWQQSAIRHFELLSYDIAIQHCLSMDGLILWIVSSLYNNVNI